MTDDITERRLGLKRRGITVWDRQRAELTGGQVSAEALIDYQRERFAKGRISQEEFERRVAWIVEHESC